LRAFISDEVLQEVRGGYRMDGIGICPFLLLFGFLFGSHGFILYITGMAWHSHFSDRLKQAMALNVGLGVGFGRKNLRNQEQGYTLVVFPGLGRGFVLSRPSSTVPQQDGA
jgi:hypothetical protein